MAEKDIIEKIRSHLIEMQDLKYREFQCGLMPTVKPETVLGVRTPQLRSYAKKLSETEDCSFFLNHLPHIYYEENNLHAFLIEGIREYSQAVAAVEAFLPYIDNWATCDMMSPKIFRKHLPELADRIAAWLNSEHTYTVRFGIGMLLRFYLDDAFKPEYLNSVASIMSEEYYVKMMIAWYFATALAKQYNAALPYIERCCLEPWTHNKTIQKALESNRITNKQKAYLRQLKCKGAKGEF